MSAVLKSKDEATLRVKFEDGRILFILKVGKCLSTSEEFMLCCIRCIERGLERGLDNLVGYEIPLHFETTRVLPEHNENMAQRVCNVCEALEILYPGLNERIQQKLYRGLNTRLAVCDTFRDMRNVIFQESVTWEKIIALFSFVGALVVECVSEGNAEFVVNLMYSVKTFAENELIVWIKHHNGWGGMARQFQLLETERSCELLPKGFIPLLKTLLQQDLVQCTNTLASLLQDALVTSKYFMLPWTPAKKSSRPVQRMADQR